MSALQRCKRDNHWRPRVRGMAWGRDAIGGACLQTPPEKKKAQGFPRRPAGFPSSPPPSSAQQWANSLDEHPVVPAAESSSKSPMAVSPTLLQAVPRYFTEPSGLSTTVHGRRHRDARQHALLLLYPKANSFRAHDGSSLHPLALWRLPSSEHALYTEY